jgi:cytochrome c-type biogenesis protein CcsB
LESKYIRVPFNDFFDENGRYILAADVELSYEKLPKDRDQYDKDLIKVDERVNICFAVYGGGIFRLFPLPNDSNNTWLTSVQASNFRGNDSLFVANIIPMYFKGVKEGFETNKWQTADTIISYIKKFQLKYGAKVLPVQTKIDLEIIYNKLNIFSRLFLYYFLVGVLLLSLIIVSIFNDNRWLNLFIQFLKWLIIVGFIAHIAGLALRWYISDHAPWSNGYESMIYIAWATILSGIIFSKKSLLTLAATSIVSGLLLMVAHLNWLDPEITNLVPVLKSYWLMIHVAIITASYGFLSLGAILGLIALWLIIFTTSSNKSKLKNILSEITIINEKSLEIGLFMLAIGTFLGGVWANESWGRYWGWDPKETWALVSVLIYSFVLHMRFIPLLRSQFTFNMVSMFAIWTIIMTYFGVNYYLSGLHSYAAGDPMPIPTFVYYLFALMFVTAIIAKIKFKNNY